MKQITLSIAFIAILIACKKETTSTSSSGTTTTGGTTTGGGKKDYHLVIEQGARSVSKGNKVSYSAYLVDKDGNKITTGKRAMGTVTWSSSSNDAGSFSGSEFTATKDTSTFVSAKVTYEGEEYTASVPLGIHQPKNAEVFGVIPSAIIWLANDEPIELHTVYFGSSNPTFSFSSTNTSIASVTPSGIVSCLSPGTAEIKVEAQISGAKHEYRIPVLVVGKPEVPLPVTKITISPVSIDLFKGETQQLVAKAFNSEGTDVTSTVNFDWKVFPKDSVDGDLAVDVNSTGVVTTKTVGEAYVQVSAKGLIAQCEIRVNPDTIILVEPFIAELGGEDWATGNPRPDNETFTAKTYKIDRAAYRANGSYLNQITNPANLSWYVPLTGISFIDEFFDIVTLSNQSSTSCKATKKPSSSFGQTFLIADVPGSGIDPGVAIISVED